jgi:Domain of unknown function (DUF4386)
MKTARTPGAYASAITHVGRRSGRVYETPARPFATDAGFTSPSPMFADKTTARKSAIWVGVLWIMATVFPASSIVPWNALDDGEGILANAATHKNQLITWALLNLVGAVAAAGVAFMFYPILNRVADTSVKKGLTLWYVGTRITEGCFYLVAVLATWAFLPLSREFAAAGAPDASHFQTSGIVLQTTQDLALALAQSVFAIGAVMLYYLLFQSRLVPRWLSLWGLVAAPLFLIASLSLLWTGDPNSTLANILFVPLGLQEMVLAVWLIVKGFKAAPLASGPAVAEAA